LKTALAANDSIEMATAYSGLSNNFARLAKYDSAIEYIRQAYDLDLALGDSSSLSSDLNSLGFLLGSKGDFEKAIYYYETSLEYLKPGELNKRAFRFNNLGMMKIELALYDEARQDIEQSLKLHRALGDSLKAAERKMNLAKLFNKTGQFNLAYDYINYAINHFVEAQHKALEIRGRITLATMLIDQKKWNLAESELQKCIALASEKELLEEMVRAFKLLVSVYDAQNRIAEAYATLKEYQVYSDSLKKSDQLKSINDLEFKFVTDIKEKEIELLQLSKAKSETELKSKSRENTILLIVGIVIMIVFVVLSIFQRQKFRLKQALLSQEIDTLRVQINALFGGGVSELNISLDQINKGLYKPISEREFEILKYAMSDKNNSEIAEAVFLSVNTVKFHLRNIYEKLGVSNRKEALELILSKS
ncbi:MAG: helix-turn-helix transcriptional regulator, partial [Fulvivirga sp.]